MEEDGEPGVEQPEEVKKKKRVCTPHTCLESYIVYHTMMDDFNTEIVFE